jgi:hypothetical protein
VKIHTPLLSTTEKAAQEGLRKGMKAVLERARDLSPDDTGQSDKSGFTRVDDLTGQAGFTSLVSLLQHENLDYQHANGGQAKFLETAAAEIHVEAYVADEIRKAFS